MAVGKGSIQRVKVATGSVAEEPIKAVAETDTKKSTSAKMTEVKKTSVPKKEAEKKAPVKKSAAKKSTAKKPAAPKKDDIHEKKFEMIDGIYCELPTYLL